MIFTIVIDRIFVTIVRTQKKGQKKHTGKTIHRVSRQRYSATGYEVII